MLYALNTNLRRRIAFRNVYEYWSLRFSSQLNVDSHRREAAPEAERRRRKTEWKRLQRGQTFLDNLIVSVQAGKGGDGCVAFHREKFKPYGPPSGGNGGKGGDVYILPTPELTTLSSVPKKIRGAQGGHGQGTWMNGRSAPPTVIKVPVGTVVKELVKEENEYTEDHQKANEALDENEQIHSLRKARWVHYPGAEGGNLEGDFFRDAERILYRQEREKRLFRRQQKNNPIFLDLDSPRFPHTSSNSNTPSFVKPSTLGLHNDFGYLVATGGEGGVGNPAFLTTENRSPKFATRGSHGQQIILSLELKTLADIGLVGFPNAGKSTLLRALTGGRARTEVASYAFTTLNPVVGVVRISQDGKIMAGSEEVFGLTIDETKIEDRAFDEKMRSGQFAFRSKSGSESVEVNAFDIEAFRFTVADNPGLIEKASEDVGLGHSFLRSIERSLALVYVVDLSVPEPEEELRVLREELEVYKPGLSNKARLVVANKADLLVDSDQHVDKDEVAEARKKLQKLEAFVRDDFGPLDVVAISAKYSQNLVKVLSLLRQYVEEAKSIM